MFYRIFLYKMFASSIFIFTFATGNKNPMYPYTDVQIAIRQNHRNHIIADICQISTLFLYQPIKEKKRL